MGHSCGLNSIGDNQRRWKAKLEAIEGLCSIIVHLIAVLIIHSRFFLWVSKPDLDFDD